MNRLNHWLNQWGFSWSGWQTGARGEYWVLLQGILFLVVLVLPAYPILNWSPDPNLRYALWAVAGLLGLGGLWLCLGGVWQLGSSLTPLPYPREDGQLVRSGVYGLVRHPIYTGVIVLVLAIALAQLSLSHLAAALGFLVFFDAKARQEETWLMEKYADYGEYRQQVKKLIPWVY